MSNHSWMPLLAFMVPIVTVISWLIFLMWLRYPNTIGKEKFKSLFCVNVGFWFSLSNFKLFSIVNSWLDKQANKSFYKSFPFHSDSELTKVIYKTMYKGMIIWYLGWITSLMIVSIFLKSIYLLLVVFIFSLVVFAHLFPIPTRQKSSNFN